MRGKFAGARTGYHDPLHTRQDPCKLRSIPDTPEPFGFEKVDRRGRPPLASLNRPVCVDSDQHSGHLLDNGVVVVRLREEP